MCVCAAIFYTHSNRHRHPCRQHIFINMWLRLAQDIYPNRCRRARWTIWNCTNTANQICHITEIQFNFHTQTNKQTKYTHHRNTNTNTLCFQFNQIYTQQLHTPHMKNQWRTSQSIRIYKQKLSYVLSCQLHSTHAYAFLQRFCN